VAEDKFHSLMNLIDHNRYRVCAAILCAALVCIAVFCVSCSSITPGLAGNDKVDRATLIAQAKEIESDLTAQALELEAEQKNVQAKMLAVQGRLDDGLTDLDRQDATKARLLQLTIKTVSDAAQGNPIDVAASIGALGMLAAGLMGIGSTMDSRRKDKVITDLKNGKPVEVPETKLPHPGQPPAA